MVVVVSLLIAFLMLNNIDTYYRYVRETETTRQEIARIEAQIAQEQKRRDAATSQIGTLDLERLASQTRFINARLAERAFSWSELLDRLEGILPSTVRVTSISPSFSENGLVKLNVNLESKTSDGMVITIDRFTASPHFANPFPSSETRENENYRFSMTVDYRPSIPRVVERGRR